MTSPGQPLISVHPEELKFIIELEKPSYCDLKVVNNTENHVAFKVKTTSPKKYFVRPNTNVIQPWDACFIKVTLQAQQEYPPDMLCKDKFLLQSTVVPPNSDVYDLSPETFNKGEGKIVEECKLRVVYVSPNSGHEGDAAGDSSGNPDNAAVQRAKDERDAVVRQTQQLQRELDMLKKRKNKGGASFKFAMIVALVGIMLGFFLNIYFSSTSPSPKHAPSPSPSPLPSPEPSPSVSTKME